MPTSVIGRVTLRPAIVISPWLRWSRPATMSISVLLPQPEGPTTETNSPASMSTVTSFSARNGASLSSPKTFVTRRSAIGTPTWASAAAGSSAGMLVMSRALCPRRLRRFDAAERHLGDEQHLASALHDAPVLVHHLRVERGDGLRRPRLAVAQ